MKKIKIFVCLIIVIAVLGIQVKAASALPEALTGTVQSVTLETDTNTATTTVLIELLHNENEQTVRVNLDTAISLGLLTLGGDGNPVINEAILGQLIEIDAATIITDEQENQHPVADALATFFSDIAGLDDETIMSVHDQGTGFGVIAQALWLTRKLDGNAEIFLAIIAAKETRDFSSFVLEDGTTPENWGQFKQAVLNGKKGKPSVTLADNKGNGDGNNGIPHNDNGNGKNKNKNNKENHDQRNNRNNSDR